jgi:broad specificity phosphatase PhoE
MALEHRKMTREQLWYSGGYVKWDAELRDYVNDTDPKILIYALRHGSTHLNEDNKFRGWIDVPLDENGKDEALEAGRFLAGRHISAIYCSDLMRAYATAELVGDVLKLDAREDKALRSWDIGYLSGMDKVKDQALLEHFVDNPDEQIPGGESLTAFCDRMQSTLDKYFKIARATGPILLVFHTSNVVQLGNYCKGEPTARPESDETVLPGGVLCVTDVNGRLVTDAILKDGGKSRYGS